MFPVHCSIQRETMNPSPVKAHLYSLFPRDDNVSVSHFLQNNSTSGLVQGCVCVCVGGRNCRTNMIRQTLDIAGRMFVSVRTRWQDLPSAPPPIHTSRVREAQEPHWTLREWPHRADPPLDLSRPCHSCLLGNQALDYTLCC